MELYRSNNREFQEVISSYYIDLGVCSASNYSWYGSVEIQSTMYGQKNVY